MGLIYTEIKAVRNIDNIAFSPHPFFNVFYGINGSGKTSILEALSLLSHGKSFRSSAVQSLIQYHESSLSVFSWIKNPTEMKRPVGIEKNRSGKTHIHLDGQAVNSSAILAELLPLQTLHPQSDILITGSPRSRRQFIDWGVFHVEPTFFLGWQRLQRSLKQRNAALKTARDKTGVCSWDAEYVQFSEIVTQFRRNYIQYFEPYFQEMIQYFLPNKKIKIVYQRGWPEKATLIQLLEKNFYRDMQLGYTWYGPHRDELSIYSDNYCAAEILSRGEQKLVVTAMRLAQGKFLKESTSKQCLYLLDDFAAELDSIHRQQVVKTLSYLQSQIFMTTIDYHEISASLKGVELNLFHVEQGKIKI